MVQLPISVLPYPKVPTGDCWHLLKDRPKERWEEKTQERGCPKELKSPPPTTL